MHRVLGFLQAGEFTVPSPATYDSEVHLTLADLALDRHSEPTVVCITIKQAKQTHFARVSMLSWEEWEVLFAQSPQSSSI